MDPSWPVFLGVVALLVGSAVLARRVSERAQHSEPHQPEPVLPPEVAAVLSVLPSSAVVLDADDDVVKASAPAYALGIVRADRIAVPELTDLVRRVRREGQIEDAELTLDRPGRGGPLYVSARVAPLSGDLVVVLVDDRTSERRAQLIRRDFVANVSHELKTPVGALALLAEAVAEAEDDPEAVSRFAARMRIETNRLGRLVQQILELSRLQGDDPIVEPSPVPVDEVVEQAVDPSRVNAVKKQVDVVITGTRGLTVAGDLTQLAVALGNLVENAVVYSSPGSTVVVDAGTADDYVDITVTDHGIGIPASEVDRIFERFYRLDPARSRSTGGSGLGLSIVKHVAASHGGEVKVWTVEGEGSSFTLRLPAPRRQPSPEPAPVEVGR